MAQVVKKQYVSKGGEWVEVPVGAGGAAAPVGMNDLTDADTLTKAPVVGDTLEWDGTNWVPVQKKLAVAILNYQGPSSPLPLWGAPVPFTTADISDSSAMTFSAPEIIVNSAGRYLVSGSVSFAPIAAAATQDQGVVVIINGTGVYWSQDRGPSNSINGSGSYSMTMTMLLAASDRVGISAATATAAGSVIERANLSVEFLGV